MSSHSQQTVTHRNALELKSSSLSVPVLVLFDDSPYAIEQQLSEKIQQAPEFFKNSPILIDIKAVQDSDIDITETVELIRKLKLLPIGLCNGKPEQNETAISLGIPVQTGVSSKTFPVADETIANEPLQVTPENEVENENETATEQAETMLITHPVRSGQRVYATGDLIITAQVSAGAEVMAEGNIHIYNRLRGRALAGVRGNTKARIFCNDVQAELISIAGNYKISENLTDDIKNKPVQIYLKDQALIIEDI